MMKTDIDVAVNTLNAYRFSRVVFFAVIFSLVEGQMSYLAIPNYRNILNFILFLSIFLASVFYVFVSELHLFRIMVPLVLIVTIFRMDGKLIIPHYIRHILLLLLAYLFYMYAITLLNNRGISINDFLNYSFIYLMTVVIFLQF